MLEEFLELFLLFLFKTSIHHRQQLHRYKQAEMWPCSVNGFIHAIFKSLYEVKGFLTYNIHQVVKCDDQIGQKEEWTVRMFKVCLQHHIRIATLIGQENNNNNKNILA